MYRRKSLVNGMITGMTEGIDPPTLALIETFVMEHHVMSLACIY